MNSKTVFLVAIIILTTAHTVVAAEQKKPLSWDLKAEGGVLYDNNLNVLELDRSSERSDNALLAQAKADLHWRPGARWNLDAGYSIASRDYQTFDDFDTLTQIAYLDARYDLGYFNLGGSYHFADADLDGDALLTLRQPSLYIARLVNSAVYVRAAVTQREKDYADFPSRDAEGNELGADLYYFFTPSTYWSISAAVEDEDAETSRYDYTGWHVRSQFSHRFELFGQRSQWQVSWQHWDRDYDDTLSLSGSGGLPVFAADEAAKRTDRRDTARLQWEQGITGPLSLITRLEYTENRSNLPSATFDETLASLSLQASF